MKVAPNTVEVSDRARRALRYHWGQSGLGTRQDFRDWIDLVIETRIETLLWELQDAEGRRPVHTIPDSDGPFGNGEATPDPDEVRGAGHIVAPDGGSYCGADYDAEIDGDVCAECLAVRDKAGGGAP